MWIGLSLGYVTKDLQKEVFIRQIKLAQEVNKPLVIHTRESIADTLEILKAHDAKTVGGVMHCYSGSVETAREFIDLNFKISLGGPVTFTNGTSSTGSGN